MKRETLLFINIICLNIIFCSCHNKTIPQAQSNVPEFFLAYQKKVSEARIFFERDTKKDKNQTLKKVPNWEKVYTSSFPEGERITVPLKYDSSYIVKTNSSGTETLSLESLSYLYIYKNAKGKYISEVVTRIPDKISDSTSKSFSGYLIREDWSGKKQKVNYYKAGKGFKFLQQKPASNIVSQGAIKEGCYYINYYNNSTPTNFKQTVCLYTLSLGCGDETILQP